MAKHRDHTQKKGGGAIHICFFAYCKAPYIYLFICFLLLEVLDVVLHMDTKNLKVTPVWQFPKPDCSGWFSVSNLVKSRSKKENLSRQRKILSITGKPQKRERIFPLFSLYNAV